MRILLNQAAEETATGSVDKTPTTAAVTETAPLSGAKEPTTPEEVITAAAEGVKKESAPPTDEKKDEVKVDSEGTEDPNAKVEDKKTETTEEVENAEVEPPPFHEHPAWQEKLKKEKELTEEVTTLKPFKDTVDSLNAYRAQHNITNEQFGEVMEIAALLNSDPQKAWEKLQPIVTTLQQFAGDSLPPELQAEVDAGTLPKARALQIAKLEAQTKVNGARQQVQQQTAQQQAVQATITAVNSWDMNRRSTDLEFAPKKDATAPDGLWEFVRDRFNLKLQSKQVKTPADAVALQEEAYKEVTASWRRTQNAKPATKKPLTSTGSSKTAAPKIETADDVINVIASGGKLKL